MPHSQAFSSNRPETPFSAQGQQKTTQLLRIVLVTSFVVGLVLLSTESALAGPLATVQTRVTAVTTGFTGILTAIGIAVLTGAFLYVGYGMAFNSKKWSDVGNVAYGALIAGIATIIVPWLFSAT